MGTLSEDGGFWRHVVHTRLSCQFGGRLPPATARLAAPPEQLKRRRCAVFHGKRDGSRYDGPAAKAAAQVERRRRRGACGVRRLAGAGEISAARPRTPVLPDNRAVTAIRK